MTCPSPSATPEEALKALKKSLPEGLLRRIPRHPHRRDIVLAIIVLGMQRRYAYSETELNELLHHELDRFRSTVDHVTCRRYLVDLGFVRRDRAGMRYLLNYPKLKSTLAKTTMDTAYELLEQAITHGAGRSPRAKPCS